MAFLLEGVIDLMIHLNDNERIDQLLSADLEIIQSQEVFCYSLDALMLAHFANIPGRDDRKIVDLCAGNGAVTLLIASQTRSQVLGVERQSRLVDMANRSIILNGMTEQVQMVQHDIRQLDALIKPDSVDLITCNPPYFQVNETNRINPNPYLAIARHEIKLSLEELIFQTARALKMNGSAYFVHRPERFLDLLSLMTKYRLVPKQIQFIYPKKNRPANMLLIHAIKDGKPNGFEVLAPLFIHDEFGNYLPEVHDIIYGSK